MLVPRVPPEAPGTRASAPRGGRATRLLAAVLTLAALVLGGGGVDAGEAGLHAERGHALPLGPRGLPEERFEQQVSPGVRYTRIVRGEQSARDFYTVDVAFRAERSDAEVLAEQLRADGHDPTVVRVSERAPDDPQRGPLGWLVRVGAFGSEADANALRDRLTAEGYAGTRVVYTGEDGGRTSGPWVVHVLEVESRRLRQALDAELATGVVPERELLSEMARRSGAAAALNGGYFVIGSADGTPGDLAGISMLDGELVSESVGDRTSLVLTGRGAEIAPVRTRLRARAADGAVREIDGLNRKPGLIRGCGGTGGDVPTELPKHDFTCTDASELILFTEAFGTTTEPGDGAEAVLDRRGEVTELRETRGGAIPARGSVLAGTGDGADWLRNHAQPGSTVGIRTSLRAARASLHARQAALHAGRRDGRVDIVNGGPRLVRNGRPAINAFAEGFHWPENPEFYYRFGVRRNPRTLAGVTAGGRVLLVAIDGRRPGHSVGASFEESAAVMRALGAEEALNLDGGGSTGMTVGSALVTRPSDAAGERPIADAILIGR